MLIEPRVRQPVVEFDLFRNKPYLGASAAAFCLVGAWWAVIFYMPQYLQGPLGYRPVVAGLMVAADDRADGGHLARRAAPDRPLRPAPADDAGHGLRRGRRALMSRLDATSGYLTVLPGFLLFGIGLGLVYSPMSIAAMEAMPRAKAGIAAGVLAMNRVLAGAILLAATGAIVAALSDSHSVTYALSRALWAPAVLCLVGAGLTWWLIADPPRATQPDHHHPHTVPH